MPRVSIVIPNYNHAVFLPQRLGSVFSQTFEDFEVIFLDDASTDDSLSALQPYESDPRLQVHLNQENSGNPFVQWNKGIDLAQGEYIWIAESDDYADLDLLRTLVKRLDAQLNAGLAYCQSSVVSLDDGEASAPVLLNEPYTSFANGERWHHDYANSGADELANYLSLKNTIPNASGVVFRKETLGNEIRAPENMRLAGDWLFWSSILARSEVAYVARPLNYFRVSHSGSQRAKTSKQGLELLEGLDVYTFIESSVELSEEQKQSALKHQVKVWGSFACLRLFSWDTNKSIYRKLRLVHEVAAKKPARRLLLPFVFYFLTAPIRQIRPLMNLYRSIRKRHRAGPRA